MESASLEAAPSAASSTGSAAGSEFFADAGPEFDVDASPAAPELEAELAPGAIEGWSEEQVRSLLVTQGQLLHLALRVRAIGDEETWKHTEDDLDAIAPPLRRLLDRYDATRALAAAGDEVVLAAGLVKYATRNVIRRRQLLRELARLQAIEEPVAGAARADPGTGPPDPVAEAAIQAPDDRVFAPHDPNRGVPPHGHQQR